MEKRSEKNERGVAVKAIDVRPPRGGGYSHIRAV